MVEKFSRGVDRLSHLTHMQNQTFKTLKGIVTPHIQSQIVRPIIIMYPTQPYLAQVTDTERWIVKDFGMGELQTYKAEVDAQTPYYGESEVNHFNAESVLSLGYGRSG